MAATTTTTSLYLNVPVIDIAPLLTGTSVDKQRVAHEVGRACADIGFLTIVGHGVAKHLVDRTYDVARRFFDLPVSEKETVPLLPFIGGYSPFQAVSLSSTLGRVAPGDIRESISYGPRFEQNPWPAAPAEFKSIWMEAFQVFDALAATIMHIFALA